MSLLLKRTLFALIVLVALPIYAGTWTALTHLAPDSINLMLLLPDGTVMAQGAEETNWYRLTPDTHGSYANGTWSTLAGMHYVRLYFSSDVLTNGQVFVAGGEDGNGSTTAEIYDPVADTWTVAPAQPNFNTFLDSCSEVLPDGDVLIAPVTPANFGETLLWNTASNNWSIGPTLFRGQYQDEASWVKLPDGSILTIDPFGENSERYIPL